jgi:hypothetical protein
MSVKCCITLDASQVLQPSDKICQSFSLLRDFKSMIMAAIVFDGAKSFCQLNILSIYTNMLDHRSYVGLRMGERLVSLMGGSWAK